MQSEHGPVVVLSSGRSGSTLLQKLLNTHSGLVIWGEHGGILNHLMASRNMVSRLQWIPEDEPSGLWLLAEDRPLNETRWTAWDGSFSKADYLVLLRGFVDSLFARDVPAGIRWGFKEIRYQSVGFMDFFSTLYPGAQYLLLTRHPLDVCVSFVSSRDQQASASSDQIRSICVEIKEKQIAPFHSLLQEALAKYGKRVLAVHYHDMLDDPFSTMDNLAVFLGLEQSFSRDSVALMTGNDIVSERKRAGSDRIEMLKDLARPLLRDDIAWYEELVSDGEAPG
jgi:hypothetical protein